jgi:Zn finger protein HypA/HybF involved in hydrogenase expression
MHELAATKEIVRIVEEECRTRLVTPRKVVVEVGEGTTYKKEPLIYYYDILKEESKVLKKSTLVVHEIDGAELKIREMQCLTKKQ